MDFVQFMALTCILSATVFLMQTGEKWSVSRIVFQSKEKTNFVRITAVL